MDLSKLVRDIKDTVRGGNTAPEFVVDLAAEHAEACEILNARLATVRRLLAGGFRSEAIALADQAPRLLDQVEQLDFPEWDAWIDLLIQKELDPPPRIDSDAAEMVEDAYDDLRRLDPLLVKHRLLALSRAPLKARLQILRKLREKDPLNPLWPEDIERLETARLQEIRAEYQRAKAKEDAATLRLLQAELEGEWSGSQASELLARLSKTTAELSREQARQEMQELAPELNSALAAFDVEQGQVLRERWNTLASVAEVSSDDPLVRSVREALAWLDEEDLLAAEQESFDRAIVRIERSIEEHCAIDDLEKQIYELQKFERELPAPLVQRIRLYRENLYLLRRRRTIAVGTAVVATVVIATVGVIAWVSNQQHRAAVTETIARLGELDQDYAAYQLYWDKLPPAIQENSDVIEVRNRLDKEYEQKRIRGAEFDRIVESIDLEGPLGPELDATVETLVDLAWSDDHRQEIEQLERKITRERESRADVRNEAFLDQLMSWISRLEQWDAVPAEQLSEDELVNAHESLELFLKEQEGILDGLPAIQPENRQQARLVLQSIDRKIRQREEMTLAARSLKELTRQVGAPEAFADQLENFASQFRTSPLAPDFQMVAIEERYWKALQSWQQLAADGRWKRLKEIPPGDAQDLLSELEASLKDSVVLRIPGEPDAVLDYLKSVMERSAVPPERLAAQVRSFCRQDTFLLQQVLLDKEGNYYYLAEPAKEDDDDVTVRYWTDIIDLETKFERFGPERVAYVGTAGHCGVAAALLEVDYRKFPTTAEYGLELLRTALEFEPAGVTVDPIPRGIIVEYLLTAVIDGAPPLAAAEGLKPMQDELGFLQVNNLDWYNPNDNGADRKRQLLKDQVFPDLIKQIKRVEAGQPAANVDVASLVSWTSLKHFAWVGWTQRLETGDWVLVSPDSVDSGEVWMLLPTGENEAELLKIGNLLEGGSLVVLEDAIESMRSGRPIFMPMPPQDMP